MKQLKHLLVTTLIGATLLIAPAATPAHALDDCPATATDCEHQNTVINRSYGAAPLPACSFQIQFGQLGATAYVQVRMIPLLTTNPPGCTVFGHLTYADASGGHEVVVGTASGTWQTHYVNNAYFIYAGFSVQTNDFPGGGWSRGEDTIGCYCHT